MRSRSNWNLEVLVFEERGKPEYPEKNLLEQGREPTTNSTHILTPGFELGPHWWEASALTTAPPLLPKFGKVRQVSTREFPTKFPGWELSHSSKFGIFMGYSLNTLKYPKM